MSRSIYTNLKAVVLDEADQLLGSDALAAQHAWRQQQEGAITAKMRAKLKRTLSSSQCEELLRELPVPLSRLQLVCASASIGRTLRRQLQPLLGAQSIDKGATLVSAEAQALKEREGERGREGLVPPTIAHRFHLWRPSAAQVAMGGGQARAADAPDAPDAPDAADAADAQMAEPDVEAEIEAAELARLALLLETGEDELDEEAAAALQVAGGVAGAVAAAEAAEAAEAEAAAAAEAASSAAVHALVEAIEDLSPAPAMLFCERKLGVRATAAALRTLGFGEVRTLGEGVGDAGAGANADALEKVSEKSLEETHADTDAHTEGGGVSSDPSSAPPLLTSSWSSTPIYVASERWARGIDLKLGYVFLLAPPATAAGKSLQKVPQKTAFSLPLPKCRTPHFCHMSKIEFKSLALIFRHLHTSCVFVTCVFE